MGVVSEKRLSMKKILLITILFFTAASSQDAYGQFWKKKKEPATRKKPVITKPKETPKEQPKKKSREIVFPKSVKKDRYRMDVLLPLYLDELVKDGQPVNKNRIPEKAQNSFSFYEGVKLAADTLTAMGYELDVFIHDITKHGETPDALAKSNSLAESDVIIGNLQSYQIRPLADYAKKKHINFISTLSPADADVMDNPYFTIIQPTLVTHIKKLRSGIFKKYPNQNIHLFYRSNPAVDSTAYKFAFEDEEKKFKRLLINTLPSQLQLQKIFDSTETNVIMMPVLDDRYAESLIEQISNWFPNYRFEIYGLPSWKFMNKLKKPEAFPNVGVVFSAPFYFDIMSNNAIVHVANLYKGIYGTNISEMSLRGYETIMWYAYLLKRYGNIFNERMNDNNFTFSKYEIVPQWTEGNDLMYNENTHFFIYRYQGGSYMVNANSN